LKESASTIGEYFQKYSPPCLFRKLPILAMIGKWYGIKIPLFFAKLLQNYL